MSSSPSFTSSSPLILRSRGLPLPRLATSLSMVTLLPFPLLDPSCHLLFAEENKALIVDMGGLDHLVRLLLSGFVEVQCNACGCLTNLATSPTNKVKIAKSGAIPYLIRLATSDDVRVQRNSTGALLNLTHAGTVATPHPACLEFRVI